jgi:hypothetical protein
MNTFKLDFNHSEVSFIVSLNFDVLFPLICYRKKKPGKRCISETIVKETMHYTEKEREREREREKGSVCVCVCV